MDIEAFRPAIARRQQPAARAGAVHGGPASPKGDARPANAAAEQAARALERRRAEAVHAAQEANRALAEKGAELTFELDDEIGRVIVKLVDSRTREVLRQIPSKEAVAIARALTGDTGPGALIRADA
jgi:flagellar protein FlaG